MPAVTCLAEGRVLQQAALVRISFVLQVSCLVIFMVLKERKEVTKLKR